MLPGRAVGSQGIELAQPLAPVHVPIERRNCFIISTRLKHALLTHHDWDRIPSVMGQSSSLARKAALTALSLGLGEDSQCSVIFERHDGCLVLCFWLWCKCGDGAGWKVDGRVYFGQETAKCTSWSYEPLAPPTHPRIKSTESIRLLPVRPCSGPSTRFLPEHSSGPLAQPHNSFRAGPW